MGLPKQQKLNKFDSGKSKSPVWEAPKDTLDPKSNLFWN
jgi:hypothetical protein